MYKFWHLRTCVPGRPSLVQTLSSLSLLALPVQKYTYWHLRSCVPGMWTSKSHPDSLYRVSLLALLVQKYKYWPEEVRARHVDVQVSSRLSLAREYEGAQAHGTSVSLLWFKKKNIAKKKLASPNLVWIFFCWCECVGTGSETFSLLLQYEHELVLFRGVLHSAILDLIFFFKWWIARHPPEYLFVFSSFLYCFYVCVDLFFWWWIFNAEHRSVRVKNKAFLRLYEGSMKALWRLYSLTPTLYRWRNTGAHGAPVAPPHARALIVR